VARNHGCVVGDAVQRSDAVRRDALGGGLAPDLFNERRKTGGVIAAIGGARGARERDDDNEECPRNSPAQRPHSAAAFIAAPPCGGCRARRASNARARSCVLPSAAKSVCR